MRYIVIAPVKNIIIYVYWYWLWCSDYVIKPTRGFYTQGFLDKGYVPVETFELNGKSFLVEHHLNNKILIRYSIEKEIAPNEIVIERKQAIIQNKTFFEKNDFMSYVNDNFNDMTSYLNDLHFLDINIDNLYIIIFLTLILFIFAKLLFKYY